MQIRNIVKNIWPSTKSDNIKPFDTDPIIDKPIYGVYHVFCVNEWVNLVKEQLGACTDSGLLHLTTKLFISCIYTTIGDIDKLKETLSQYDVDFEFVVSLPLNVTVISGRGASFTERVSGVVSESIAFDHVVP